MFERRFHRRPSGRLLLMLVLSIAFLGGCNKDTPTVVAPPEPPKEPDITELFSGSIGQSETSCHSFTLVDAGSMILTLTELEPLSSLTVGLSLGQPDAAGTCVAAAQDNSVKLLERLLSTGAAGTEFCACVLDVGNIFEDQTVDYVLQVEHT